MGSIISVTVVSQRFSETKKTSLFRRKIDLLPANSFAEFEIMQPELFALDNQFQVIFLKMIDYMIKTYIFQKGTINKRIFKYIDLLNKKGINIK